MAEFVVHAEITISTFTIVEAESKEEALQKAEERDVMSLPYLNPNQFDPKEIWVVDEIDGTPEKARIDE